MLSLLVSKIVVLVVLLLMTFGLGLIPVKLMNFFQRSAAASLERGERRTSVATHKRVLSLLSCFAAGVFLATCFLDLLPAVRRRLTTVLFELNVVTGFPLAEFIMSLGLFLILIVEQFVLVMKEQPRHSHSAQREAEKPLLGNSRAAASSVMTPVSADREDELSRSDQFIKSISDQPASHDLASASNQEITSMAAERPRSYTEPTTDHHHHHHHDVSLQSHSPLRAILLLVALSLHSVFEGLAVGLQSRRDQVLGIFAALVIHKGILSFSIGLNLVQSRLSTKSCVLSVLLFSVTAPLGVAVGILITDLWESRSSYLLDGVLQGVACGTFLYMTFFEVLPAEFNASHDRMLKLLMLLIGFGTVTGILFLSDDIKAPFCKTLSGN